MCRSAPGAGRTPARRRGAGLRDSSSTCSWVMMLLLVSGLAGTWVGIGRARGRCRLARRASFERAPPLVGRYRGVPRRAGVSGEKTRGSASGAPAAEARGVAQRANTRREPAIPVALRFAHVSDGHQNRPLRRERSPRRREPRRAARGKQLDGSNRLEETQHPWPMAASERVHVYCPIWHRESVRGVNSAAFRAKFCKGPP
jgi:hypothetical protein